MSDFYSLAPDAEQKIKAILDQSRLRWEMVQESYSVFGCLQLLNRDSLDVVAIHNSKGTNQMIHLGISFPSFSLGFNSSGNITSRSIFGAALNKGTDHCIVGDPLSLVFRSHADFARFVLLFSKYNVQ